MESTALITKPQQKIDPYSHRKIASQAPGVTFAIEEALKEYLGVPGSHVEILVRDPELDARMLQMAAVGKMALEVGSEVSIPYVREAILRSAGIRTKATQLSFNAPGLNIPTKTIEV